MKQSAKASTLAVTRRDLGFVWIAVPGIALSQQAPAEDLLASARERATRNSETLRNFKVPTATEPSFAFRP